MPRSRASSRAALWIGVAFIIARFLRTIIEAILPPTGFDDAMRSTGVLPANASASRIVANIAMIAIILVASIEAARQLGGDDIAIFLAQVTALGGKVIFGTLIIVAGIFLANIIATLVGSGTGEGSFAQTIVRYAIIALFTAIGLTFMGLADQIVMLAFGLILGSAAVATALAFGLGGRDAAGRIADYWASHITAAGRRRHRRPSGSALRPGTIASRLWCDASLRGLRRDRLVGGEGPASQGHRDRRSARRCARRGWSAPATPGRARKCSAGC